MKIPSEGVARLVDACSVRSGFTARDRLRGSTEGTLTVQQGDLSAVGEYSADKAMRVATTAFAPHHLAWPGELLFRSRGPFWSTWRVADVGEPLLAVAPLFILRPISEILDPAYLAWLLMQTDAQRYFQLESKGSGVQMITKAVLERLPLELPPLHTQRLVAATAELADEERRLLARLADLRRTRTTARLTAVTMNRNHA